jgi:hypothetical protein
MGVVPLRPLKPPQVPLSVQVVAQDHEAVLAEEVHRASDEDRRQHLDVVVELQRRRLAPLAGLRRLQASVRDILAFVRADQGDEEGAAVAVVAAGTGSAHHRGVEVGLRDIGVRNVDLLGGDGVPDDVFPAVGVEEDAAVAAVEHVAVAAVGVAGAKPRGGYEVGHLVVRVAEEAQQGSVAWNARWRRRKAGSVRRRRHGLHTSEARTRSAGSSGGRRRRISPTRSSISPGGASMAAACAMGVRM